MINGQDYINALEEERRKIQVFRRELPLCLELVTQAIERCGQQLLSGQLECSEQMCPILEEFIPLKRDLSDSDSEDETKKLKDESSSGDCNKDYCNEKNGNKSDWLRSVQLWNQTPDPIPEEDSVIKFGVSEVKRDGAFHAFSKEKNSVGVVTATISPLSPSFTAETGGGKKEEKEGHRKSRRCWSPELHRRFIQALQQLGGSHVATPKQIRELMKVDGLTNDEVKSHLQKYRLHTRRPSNSTHNNNTQTPQFLVVGGIWVPPEYAAMAATTTSSEESGGSAAKRVYAPIAAPPPPPFRPSSQCTKSGGSSKGTAVQSCSRGSSSSTHTTTVSPAC